MLSLVIFVMQKLVIVRDWIISADEDSNAFDFECRVLFSVLLSRASPPDVITF